MKVALLAEGVDRNSALPPCRCPGHVALLAEGVDRNLFRAPGVQHQKWSPSSRRAWIEIVNVRELCF